MEVFVVGWVNKLFKLKEVGGEFINDFEGEIKLLLDVCGGGGNEEEKEVDDDCWQGSV